MHFCHFQEDERSILRDEVLRGKSLAPVSDRLTSPPPASAHTGLSFPRNGALPPISYDQHTSDVKVSLSVSFLVLDTHTHTHTHTHTTAQLERKTGK